VKTTVICKERVAVVSVLVINDLRSKRGGKNIFHTSWRIRGKRSRRLCYWLGISTRGGRGGVRHRGSNGLLGIYTRGGGGVRERERGGVSERGSHGLLGYPLEEEECCGGQFSTWLTMGEDLFVR
jgi:hypothetical protein